MLPDQFFSGRNLFVLAGALSAHFIVPLLPANSTKHMSESRFLRYFLGFLTLVFFVVVTDTAEIDRYMPLGTIITTSAALFVWFIMAAKMTANWWYMLVLIFGAIYLVNLYEDRHLYTKDLAETFATVKGWLLTGSVFMTVIGFLIYVGEKKMKYRGKFNYGDFLFGLPKVGGPKEPSGMDYWVALKAAFTDVGGVGGVGGKQRGGGLEGMDVIPTTDGQGIPDDFFRGLANTNPVGGLE